MAGEETNTSPCANTNPSLFTKVHASCKCVRVSLRPCLSPEPQRAPPHLNVLGFGDLTFEEDGQVRVWRTFFSQDLSGVSPAPFPSNFQQTKCIAGFGSELRWASAPSPWLFLVERPLRSWPQSMLALLRAREDPALYREGVRTQSR